MLMRWMLGIGIVGFWLAMMWYLIRINYYPDGVKEDSLMVLDRFLSREQETGLDIIKGKDQIGFLRMEPTILDDRDVARTGARSKVRARGMMKLDMPAAGGKGLEMDLDCEVYLTKTGEVKQSRVRLAISQLGISLVVDEPAGGNGFIRLEQGLNVIFDTRETKGTAAGGNLLELLLAGLGVDASALTEAREVAGDARTEARRGRFALEGVPGYRDTVYEGYTLSTVMGPGLQFVLYLTNEGEVMRMAFYPSASGAVRRSAEYEFVSEDLRLVKESEMARRRRLLPPDSGAKSSK